MHIICDVDGVLADSITKTVLTHMDGDRAATAYTMSAWPAGVYPMHEVLEITADELWRPIDTAESWWLTVEPYPWTYPLVAALRDLATKLTIASVPRAGSERHKREWMRIRAAQADHYVLCTPNKACLAGPDCVLIDDSDREVESFIAAGGRAVLFPQRWNSRHAEAGESAWELVVEAVSDELPM